MKSILAKKGAIEMSIGTIVIVVLAMIMLSLGIVLVRTIFKSATNIADMTDEQLRSRVSEIFSEEQKLVVYPESRKITLKQGADPDGFGIGIQNLIQGTTEVPKFSYEVIASDPDMRANCAGLSEREAEGFIKTGRTEDNLEIAPGDMITTKILLQVPVGAPLCTIRYRVNVRVSNVAYASEIMDVVIKAK